MDRASTLLSLVDCHHRPDLVAEPEDINGTISDAIDIALNAAVKLYALDHKE